MKSKGHVIWMEVDLKDKELPTGRMGDSAEDLARACGVKRSTICSAICYARKNGQKCRYVKVVL